MVNTALKNQIISVFEDPYLSMMINVYTDFSTKTKLDIFQHLYTHYACISATDIFSNDERLQSPYNVE